MEKTEKNYLIEYRNQIASLSEKEQKLRDLYLRQISNGEILGPMTGYASIDKPWLKYYTESCIYDEIPDTNLYSYLYKKNKDNLDGYAINYYDHRITYKQLFKNIDAISKSFIANGIKKGDVVSFCMPNLPETIYCFFALNKIGAVANFIDPRINLMQIEKFINDSNSKLLITIEDALPKIKEIENKINVEKVVIVSPSESLPLHLKQLYKIKNIFKQKAELKIFSNDWKDFINDGYNCQENNIQSYGCLEDISEIVYTTGTTGTPKGAMITNKNSLAMIKDQLFSIPYMKKNEKFLGIMPPFLAYGSLWGMIIPLMSGQELIVIPKFKVEDFANLMIKYKPNYVMGVPSFWEELSKSESMKNFDLSFLKCPIAGGNSMTIASEIRLNDFFKSHNCSSKMLKGYGMTEVSSAIAFTASCECNKIGSVGIPLSKNVIKICDGDLSIECHYNEKGDIYLSGPIVINGYFNNPEEAAKTFITDEYGKKWVKSGDIGYIDEDGCVFITGRSKRTLVRADGHNVFPGEMENVISMHDAVDSCCVVGIKSHEYDNGDIPVAFVTLKDEYIGSENEIEESIKSYCLTYLQQRDVALAYVFINKIPVLPDGKVDYMRVSELANVDYSDEIVRKLKIN